MDYEFEKKWGTFCKALGEMFEMGDADLKSVLYLIGVQELGHGFREFSKKEKMDLYHIATCRVLEPYNYYSFSHYDEEGWPHFEVEKKLPFLKEEQQEKWLKQAVIEYFERNEIIRV